MKTTRDLVDVREAARLSGLDKGTIYRLARHGKLRSFRVLGRAVRFDRADLLTLVKTTTKRYDSEEHDADGHD